MGKGNILGIAVSALSVLVIGGSVYYYNANVSKSSEKIQQTTVTTTTVTTEKKLVLNKENVKISTEVKDEKTAVVTIENIADRNLVDVVVEGTFKEGKIAEVLIPTLNKGDKKKIELPLDNKLNAVSIKENPELTGNFRMVERAEFTVAENKGEILVSTLKAQEKSFYIEKIKSSTLEQSTKDDLIKKVEKSNDIFEIEKLLKENKIIEELALSSEHVVFKDGESEMKLESNSVNEETTTSTTTQSTSSSTSSVSAMTTGVIRQPVVQSTTSQVYGYIPQQTTRRITTQAPVRTTAVTTAAAPTTVTVPTTGATEGVVAGG
ncbi:MAG: hypothetical protein Q3988_05470 [Gemella sp.]|nr:hypothetical protein [Gemella sp.]